jgi:hypothetical protein
VGVWVGSKSEVLKRTKWCKETLPSAQVNKFQVNGESARRGTTHGIGNGDGGDIGPASPLDCPVVVLRVHTASGGTVTVTVPSGDGVMGA